MFDRRSSPSDLLGWAWMNPLMPHITLRPKPQTVWATVLMRCHAFILWRDGGPDPTRSPIFPFDGPDDHAFRGQFLTGPLSNKVEPN